MVRPFKKVKTGDRVIDSIQDAVDDAIRPLNACPLVNGVLIGPVTFVSGVGQRVSHGLQRTPLGWFLCSPNANARVWEGKSPNPNLQLVMTGSANLTTDIWFF